MTDSMPERYGNGFLTPVNHDGYTRAMLAGKLSQNRKEANNNLSGELPREHPLTQVWRRGL